MSCLHSLKTWFLVRYSYGDSYKEGSTDHWAWAEKISSQVVKEDRVILLQNTYTKTFSSINEIH